ncbi:MAG: sulfite exporter TauE/SafE family protein [Haliscomenobacteraceae bacterium CHB4]|nr:putative membrane transporter protein YfcA [Saprospiraceae bacterium]MCE7924500.1 sulfite exporter TauE/SafE family protein [Haliscomenobacteraceae bacterium CHB4]
MELYLLCLFAFLAGFIDSIVGGGGLVQVPAFFVLYPTLSVPNIIGTNRLASAVGTSIAAWNYARNVRIPWKTVLYAGVSAAVFSYLGATVQSLLPSSVLKPVILILIVAIAVYTYRKKDFGQNDHFRVAPERLRWWASGIGAVLGFYNGFIGPGTGSLLVFGFVSIIGYSFLTSSAISKVVNVIADVSSLVFFLANKYVLFHLALPMMACNVAGSYLGSHMAMLRGNAFIRKVFLVVVAGIVLRFAWDVVLSFRH